MRADTGEGEIKYIEEELHIKRKVQKLKDVPARRIICMSLNSRKDKQQRQDTVQKERFIKRSSVTKKAVNVLLQVRKIR